MDVIELQDIVKSYAMGDTVVMALNHVSVKFEQSKFTSIVGPSGSGKSTMMNILGCLDRPTSGHYLLEGKDIAKYSDDELARTRNQRIGFVFQSFNLLSRLTAVENVALPLIYAGVKLAERTERAEKALEAVGLGKRLYHKPNEMSGGQRQRVAIARALTMEPALLIADEPTSMLDPSGKANLLRMLKGLQNNRGFSMLFITHDLDSALKISDRLFRLEKGALTRLNPNDYIQVRFDGLFDAG